MALREIVRRLLLPAGMLLALPLFAQPEAQTGAGAFDRETIAAARTEIERALAEAGDGERVLLLQEQLEELGRAAELLELNENPPPEMTIDPPSSLRDLDGTIERLNTVGERIATLDEAVRSAERALERSIRLLDDARKGFAQGAGSRDAVRVARERVLLARFQLRNVRLEREIATKRERRLQTAVETKRGELRVGEEDLTAPVAELETQLAELREQRPRLQDETGRAASALRQALDASAGEAQAAALRARVEALERRAALLDAREVDLERAIEAWTLRYRLAAGELDADDEERARRRLAADLSDLVRARDLARAESERLRVEIQRAEASRDAAGDAERLRWIDERLSVLSRRLESETGYEDALAAQIADHRRYLDAFGADGVAGNVRVGVTTAWQTVVDAWHFEIATIDDRSVTVGKLVLALILIVAGVFLSRLMARILRRRVFDRMPVDTSLAASLQTLTLYVFVLLFFLAALRFVSIPLTALTFVGGALAIGVGFGSQNVVNNFISGVILMVERPVKVGDMIEVGGTFGIVERIGGRSTRVRAGDNTHVIVPNSSFLEKEVLNWTLADTRLRTHVDVGIAYGSPTREASRLMLRAVQEHGKVLESPQPEVLFLNFGDNALEFRVYFWITVRQVLDRLRVQSDVRYKIDALFRDAGITIAFPQRDVHLDGIGPLDVRVLPAPPDQEP